MEKQILAIGYYHKGQTIILLGDKMNTSIQRVNVQHREIPISQLPNYFSYKSILENMVEDASKATVIVTAKRGMIGDWAAYIGWPALEHMKEYQRNREEVQYYCSTLRTPSQVLAYGDKLDKQSAEEIFPDWSYLRYRE